MDKPVVPSADWRDKELALMGAALRTAIEEAREKKEAVAAAMDLTDAAYLSKLFTAEKPLTARHIVALPPNVARIFARLCAESKGLICVEPLEDDDIAIRNFVGGLVALMRSRRLPARADGMARVTVRPRMAKVRA